MGAVIFGMLRIKNEERWIRRVLQSLVPVCERIFILDDNSTDSTPGICESFERVTLFRSPFTGVQEVRDKNWLLAKVGEKAKVGDWIIAIDGDEEIAPGGADIIQWLTRPKWGDSISGFRFRVLYLWDDPEHIRVDGIYGRFTRPSMFKFRNGLTFKSGTNGGFHCGNVPKPMDRVENSAVKLLHYGYMYKEDRIRKWHWYNSIDPKNRAEGYQAEFPERRSYGHMVQGDVPEVPADVKLIHAGPLKLEQFSA